MVSIEGRPRTLMQRTQPLDGRARRLLDLLCLYLPLQVAQAQLVLPGQYCESIHQTRRRPTRTVTVSIASSCRLMGVSLALPITGQS